MTEIQARNLTKFSVDWNPQLWVFGNGYVIPSTLKELEKGRRYSLDVALNTTATPTGKVTAVVASDACADAAGNTLQRTNQSSFLVRFGNDRRHFSPRLVFCEQL